LAWFMMLKNSARNCTLSVSEILRIGAFLNTEKSLKKATFFEFFLPISLGADSSETQDAQIYGITSNTRIWASCVPFVAALT
jgi:hypothetical protein